MFVTIKNNMKDATAVVAFTHIPPGEVRKVEQLHYSKWFKGGGHRLLDAGMVAEIHKEAQTQGAVIAPARPVEEAVPDTFVVPSAPAVEEAEPDVAPDSPAAEAADEVVAEELETNSNRRKRRG